MFAFAQAVAAFGLLWLTTGAFAGEVAVNPSAAMRPTAKIARIPSSEAPEIDADLSDPAWAKAGVIEDFRQRQPNPGGMPTERTVLRVMYDDNNIYFGVYAYDSNPDAVIVRSMSRDGQIVTGDNVEIILDPAQTRRNAYVFMVGPSGGRWDGLRLNNREELPEWNTIWAARSRRVSDGWVAEIAIPFRSISFVPGQTEWGFDFTRNIRRKTEIVRWSSINPALQITDVSESGNLTGFTEVQEGLGLDVVPYLVFRTKHDWGMPGDGAGLSATMGGNAFYKITPGLTGTITVNPDFSDAPLDVREVNTTRFSLFLPETRSFFLQDAGAFEFGGRPFKRTSFDRQSNNARPFFSRNVGLVSGQPVSLIGGGKLSGEYGGFNVGALSVLTDKTPSSDGQVLSVMRATHTVFNEQSRMGFILTNGDPTGLSKNTVAGADFQYRDTTLFNGNTIQADAYYERSFSNTKGDDASYAFAVYYPNEPWSADFSVKTVGTNFTPALGFVNRRGIRYYDGFLGHLERFRDTGGFFRTFELNTRHEVTTDLDGLLLSRESRVQIQFETTQDHSVSGDAINNFDRLSEPFELPHNVTIPAGNYEWYSYFLHLRTSQRLPVSLHFDSWCCDYYNGTQLRVRPEFSFKPSEYYEVEANYDGTFIRLPGGNVDIHIFSLNGIFNFTPDMQFAMQAQYDTASQGFGFLGRYRWEFRPGSEIFIAAGQTANVLPGSRFEMSGTQVSFRISHTLQY
jgi:hypothetical protein